MTKNGFNVHIDDFSSSLIDISKWERAEWVREPSNGYLRTNIIGYGSTQTAGMALTEEDAPYLKAKIYIDSTSQLSDGAWGIGRLQGYYYNDSRGPGSGQSYNKYEGDDFAQIRLRYSSDGTLFILLTENTEFLGQECNLTPAKQPILKCVSTMFISRKK